MNTSTPLTLDLTVSTKRDCIGKKPLETAGQYLAGLWKTETLSVRDLITLNYIQGVAIAQGVFNQGPLNRKATNKNNDDWLYSELIVVDIDDTKATLDDLLNPFVLKYCLAITPSSGYSPATPKYHLFFVLDKPVTRLDVFTGIADYVGSQLPSYDASLSRPAQALYGTVFYQETMQDHVKSLDDGLVWVNPASSKLPADQIIADLVLDTDRNDRTSTERATEHENQPADKRLEVVIEAVDYAFREWGRGNYEDWLAITISAYAGSSDIAVRDAILSHPDIEWSRGEQNQFVNWWSRFRLRPEDEGGYTVGTLFYYARLKGWLQHTSVEIPDERFVNFDSREVADWLLGLEDVPTRVLIKSNTGTGKTRGAILLLKKLIEEGHVTKRAVFFAPSIKLCVNLSHTLRALGVENTLYIDGAKTKDYDTLRDAKVLVTTLQTFSIKLSKRGVNIDDYEFVAIDESDELISSFVRAEIGYTIGFSSHVNRLQSFWGVKTLRELFRDAKYLYMLDGTATQVSLVFGDLCTPKTNPLVAYRNLASREKAPVKVLPTLHAARDIVLKAVEAGRRVVVPVDTKREARVMYNLVLNETALDEDDIIMITSETSLEARTRDFFEDVEAGAAKYRVVIYNSAMGSGVSIVGTKPDVIVQVCTHVTPAKNVQILNRYRDQPEKHVYVYMPPGENLYQRNIQERMDDLILSVDYEAGLTGIEPIERHETAALIERIALLSLTDVLESTRSKREYYLALLRAEGRSTAFYDYRGTKDTAAAMERVRAIIDAERDEVYRGWRMVEPISRDTPPDQIIDALDYAKGRLHHWIKTVLPDYEDITAPDPEIARLVDQHGRYVWVTEHWLNPERPAEATLRGLLDRERSKLTFGLFLARLELVGLVGRLFQTSKDEVSLNTGAGMNATKFLHEVQLRKSTYDNLRASGRLNYDNILAACTGPDGLDETEAALRIARVILDMLGLKLRRKNGPRLADGTRSRLAYIDAEPLLKLLEWRNNPLEYLYFTDKPFYDTIKDIRKSTQRFNELPEIQQASVIERMKTQYFSFRDAVGFEDNPF